MAECGTAFEIQTTFGDVSLVEDGKKCKFHYEMLEPKEPYQDVNGVCRITYCLPPDDAAHTLHLRLNCANCDAGVDGGEGMVAVTADIGSGRITLSYIETEAVLGAYVLADGLEIRFPQSSLPRTVRFGVCWIDRLPSEFDVQTWLGADV